MQAGHLPLLRTFGNKPKLKKQEGNIPNVDTRN
jgi:hypothetical protein